MADPIEGQSVVTENLPTPEGTETLPVVDQMATKLEGDKVPEKFRGKTLGDVLTSYGESENAKTKAEQESAQWRTWAATKLADLEARTAVTHDVAPAANPLAAFDEDQQKSLLGMFTQGMQPIIDGLSSLMKEVVKSNRPDFDEVKDSAATYYNQMPYAYKVHPEYGWDYAYRMAKADQLKHTKSPPPPQPGPTSGSPGAPAIHLTADEKDIAQRFGLTDAEYVKLKEPVDVTTLKRGK